MKIWSPLCIFAGLTVALPNNRGKHEVIRFGQSPNPSTVWYKSTTTALNNDVTLPPSSDYSGSGQPPPGSYSGPVPTPPSGGYSGPVPTPPSGNYSGPVPTPPSGGYSGPVPTPLPPDSTSGGRSQDTPPQSSYSGSSQPPPPPTYANPPYDCPEDDDQNSISPVNQGLTPTLPSPDSTSGERSQNTPLSSYSGSSQPPPPPTYPNPAYDCPEDDDQNPISPVDQGLAPTPLAPDSTSGERSQDIQPSSYSGIIQPTSLANPPLPTETY